MREKIQWLIAITIFMMSFFISAVIGALIAYNFIWIWLIFLLPPIYYIFSAPILKLIGYFVYLSPMLVVSKPSDKIYKLHDGTLLDFFIVMKKYGRINLRKKILCYYLSGILEIIKKIKIKLCRKV